MRMIYTHHPNASIALKEAWAIFVAIAIIVVVALFVLLFLNSDRGSGDSEFKNKNYWQDGADNYWEPSSPLALGNHALPIFHIIRTYRTEALACTATPAAPAGPMYPKEEVVAILKEHLQTKILAGENVPCLMAIQWYGNNNGDKQRGVWNSRYDKSAHRWDVSFAITSNSPMPVFTWSVYERTKSIVATGDDPLNQMC